MRETLFRGKPKNEADYQLFAQTWKDNCKDGFVFGSLVVSKNKVYICVSALCQVNSLINNGTTTMLEVIPETVGQYTGITVEGKKIFEGDIVKKSWTFHYYVNHQQRSRINTFIGQIVFDRASYIMKEHGEFIGTSHNGEWLEVIGNIYDNPELLEGDLVI